MEYLVRKATSSDLDEIGELWVKLSEDHLSKDPYNKGNMEIKFEKQLFKQNIESTQCAFFVVEANGMIVGFTEIWLQDRDFYFYLDEYAYSLHTFVEPNYRFASYELYKASEDWAVSKGCRYIQADVFCHNGDVEEILKCQGFSPYRKRLVKEL